MSATITSAPSLLAVDSHVHLHDWIGLVPLLDAALASFSAAVAAIKGERDFSGILVLTEPLGRDTYARLHRQCQQERPCRLNPTWHLETTAEPLSLAACHTSGRRLFLLSGQQVITRERLEVLGLVMDQSVADGLSLTETIDGIRARGGFPVLPWGVGKWLFGRGTKVSEAIAAAGGKPLALGDNGGRPAFWRSIRQFAEARRFDIPVLHGSDPLPVSADRRNGGSNGDLLSCSFSPEYPGTSLLKALYDRSCEQIPFASRASTTDFLRDQLLLRLN